MKVSPLDCVDAAGEVDLPIELFVSPFGRGFGALQQQKDGEFVLSHDVLILELCCNNLVTAAIALDPACTAVSSRAANVAAYPRCAT